MKKQFVKPPTTIDEQIQKTVDRGLILGDDSAVRAHFKSIGYYRLTGYFLPFQVGGTGPDRHNFIEGASFESILQTYWFDRELKLILLDAIEHIEVYLRAELSGKIAIEHGSHWYLNDSLFQPDFDHAELLNDIKSQIAHQCDEEKRAKRRSLFIDSYYKNYYTPDTPACWMIFQAVSLGVTSKVYDGLYKSETRHIFNELKINNEVFSSWIHAISYVRNLCAHHWRVWNKTLTIKPMIANKHKTKFHGNKKIYSTFVVLKIILDGKKIQNTMHIRLAELIERYPTVAIDQMGFPEDWSDLPPWSDDQ